MLEAVDGFEVSHKLLFICLHFTQIWFQIVIIGKVGKERLENAGGLRIATSATFGSALCLGGSITQPTQTLRTKHRLKFLLDEIEHDLKLLYEFGAGEGEFFLYEQLLAVDGGHVHFVLCQLESSQIKEALNIGIWRKFRVIHIPFFFTICILSWVNQWPL